MVASLFVMNDEAFSYNILTYFIIVQKPLQFKGVGSVS